MFTMPNTVNVIEIPDQTTMSVGQLKSFLDDSGGNIEAEKFFEKLIKQNYPKTTKDEIEVALEDGYFWKDNYCVMIVHSTGD